LFWRPSEDGQISAATLEFIGATGGDASENARHGAAYRLIFRATQGSCLPVVKILKWKFKFLMLAGSMNSQILGLRVAGTVFGLAGLGQLLRLLTRAEIAVAGHQFPYWASAIAVVIAGCLSVWMWKLSSTAAK
jgi:hypothetical protein